MPTSLEALLIVAFGVVPGYIFFRALNAKVPLTQRDSPREMVSAIAASMVFWTIAAGPLWLSLTAVPTPGGQAAVIFGASALSIAIPVAAGLWIGKRIADKANLGRFLGMRPLPPTAWDFRFGRSEPLNVRVMLTDGSQLVGRWGTDSYASGHPAKEDLYLQAVYDLDVNGRPGNKQPGTAGVWIPRETIRYLLLTEVEAQPENRDAERQEAAAPTASRSDPGEPQQGRTPAPDGLRTPAGGPE